MNRLAAPSRAALLFAATLAIALAGAAESVRAAGAGIEFDKTATAQDLGLPVFPQATPRVDARDDSNGVKLSMWGGSLGLKLAVAKFHSAASVNEVAAFYRQALGTYGPVLDCSRPGEPANAASGTGGLRCDDGDKPEPGARLYMAGTRDIRRLVSIKPAAGGADFDMVRLETSH